MLNLCCPAFPFLGIVQGSKYGGRTENAGTHQMVDSCRSSGTFSWPTPIRSHPLASLSSQCPDVPVVVEGRGGASRPDEAPALVHLYSHASDISTFIRGGSTGTTRGQHKCSHLPVCTGMLSCTGTSRLAAILCRTTLWAPRLLQCCSVAAPVGCCGVV